MSVQWDIRRKNGSELGPYSTEAVLKLIKDGELLGTEYIRQHPHGKWQLISRQADFYDRLLEALEKNVKPQAPSNHPPKFAQETVIDVTPKSKQNEEITEKRSDKPEEDLPSIESILKPLGESPVSGGKKTKSLRDRPAQQAGAKQPMPTSIPQPVIELQDEKKFLRKEKLRSAVIPIALIFVAAVMGVVALFLPEDGRENLKERHLLSPRYNADATLNTTQLKQGMQKAVTLYTQDTFETYWEAQNTLVTLVEGAPQNAEARGFLCLVYKELWPFVKQDSQDLQTVTALAKSTRAVEPVGINATYCEILRMMALGRYKEARGTVEFALNQPAFSVAPVLYDIKAELLFEDRDPGSAFLYADKAAQLWPAWVKATYDKARFAKADGKPKEALALLQEVMQKNSKHKSAQIDYGEILYLQFRKLPDAERVLTAALASPMVVSGLKEATAHYLLARVSKELGKKLVAQEEVLKAHALNPSDMGIKELMGELGVTAAGVSKESRNNELIFLGDQYVRTGNCLAAQAEFKTAYELDNKNAVAAMKAAKCLWQLNQTSEAVVWLQKAIRADSQFATAYALLADYYSARFDFIQATATLNKASKVLPNNYEILRGYGLVEYRRNNPKDALGYLLRAQKIYENDVDTLVLLAKTASLNKDYSSAQKFAVKAIELDGTNTEAQVVYARVLAQFKGFDAGLLYLQDLVNKYAYTAEYRRALADLNREQQRYTEAQKIYQQLLDSNPKDKEALIGIGECQQGQNLFDSALKAFLAAAVIDPSDAEPLFRAGLVYLDANKPADAITQFKRALLVNPYFPKLNYYIGRAALLSNNGQLALDSAVAERKVNPNLADSYILSAEVYFGTRDYQKCAQEYQQAIKLRPQGAELYIKMARCYRLGGSPDVAESMLNIAATQESGNPELYKEQGAVFEQRGDLRAAAEAYNKYLGLSPNAPDRQVIESRILNLGQ